MHGELLCQGIRTQALRDIGSQVCLISKAWRKKYIPKVEVHDTEELLGPGALVGKAVKPDGHFFPRMGGGEVPAGAIPGPTVHA